MVHVEQHGKCATYQPRREEKLTRFLVSKLGGMWYALS
jgi:hypothetical protein